MRVIRPSGFAARLFARFADDFGSPVIDGWPSEKYRTDPVAFCREVLGVEPWSAQVKILEAARDHKRVSVASGNKCGKSMSVATLVLWWYCSWEDAVVVMTAPTARQVERVAWKAVRWLHARSRRPIKPDDPALIRNPALTTRAIDGEPNILSRSGLTSGFREVSGFTARDPDAVSGISGPHVLIIVDEASGIGDDIFQALEGVRGGGAHVVLISNPMKSEGELYEAFNAKAKSETNPTGYFSFHIATTETPNYIEGTDVIPGLGTREWCREREIEWGEKSALYRMRVLGQFCEFEEGKVISIKDIVDAESRWNGIGEDFIAGEGVLHIGIDPAVSMSGDEAVFVPRRGKRIFEIRAERGLRDEEGHLTVLLGMLEQYRNKGETVIVNVDALGDVGSKVYYRLRNYAEKNPGHLIVCGIRGSDNAVREPEAYVRMRDELWGAGSQWLREGGALPEDVKASKDLHSPSWSYDLKNRKIATKKDDLRKALGRSPDRGDGICLACWEQTRLVVQDQEQEKARREAMNKRQSLLDEPAAQGLDCYAAMDQWEQR